MSHISDSKFDIPDQQTRNIFSKVLVSSGNMGHSFTGGYEPVN